MGPLVSVLGSFSRFFCSLMSSHKRIYSRRRVVIFGRDLIGIASKVFELSEVSKVFLWSVFKEVGFFVKKV